MFLHHDKVVFVGRVQPEKKLHFPINRNRTGSPAQDYDQLQCLRTFPLPGVPTATDGNSPHCGIFLPVLGAVLSLIREKPSLNRLKMGHSGASYRRFLKNVLLCPFQGRIGCRIGL